MRTLSKFLIFLALTAIISVVGAVTITDQASLKNTGPNIGFKNKGTIQASDLYATDDAKVGDDLQVVGDLSVTGALSYGSGNFSSGTYDDDLRLLANHSFYSTTGSGGIDWSNATGAWKMPTGAGTVAGATDFNGAITCRNVTLDANYNVVTSGTGTITSAATITGEQVTSTDDMNVTDTLYVANIIQSNDAQFASVDITTALDVNAAATVQDITLDANKNLTMSGTGTVTTGTGAVTLAGDSTVSTNKALAVTTADKLTVGGVIIPQEMAVPFSYDANSVDIGIFSAKGAWNITAVELVPRVAGNDAGAVNVTIKVCDSGEAPSSGEAALSAVLNLKGTADTTQSGTLGSNVACTDTQFIALDFNGTLTNAVGMGTVWLKRV